MGVAGRLEVAGGLGAREVDAEVQPAAITTAAATAAAHGLGLVHFMACGPFLAAPACHP
jgi:hypothetical protein